MATLPPPPPGADTRDDASASSDSQSESHAAPALGVLTSNDAARASQPTHHGTGSSLSSWAPLTSRVGSHRSSASTHASRS